jgi:hypothetical protein
MHNQSQDQKVSRDLVADIMAEQLGHNPRLTKALTPNFAYVFISYRIHVCLGAEGPKCVPRVLVGEEKDASS